MIVLSKEQIEEMVDPDQMMDQIEEAYRIYGSGEFYMPPRPTVEHENKQLMYMPCYTKDIIGTKILSIFPENSKLGLPSIDGIVLLNDYTTGAPLAVMDGQSVTAWRTGAVGGVGIRHLSRKDCRTVGIIGAGMQGFHQAVYACAARDIHTVYVFNHSDRDLTDYLERLKKAKPYSIVVVAEGIRTDGRKRAAEYIAQEIEYETGIETRETVLGYIQRGGSPTPFDRNLSTRMGGHATELIAKGEFGRMVALKGDDIASIPLEEVAGKLKLVTEDHDLVIQGRRMGICFG